MILAKPFHDNGSLVGHDDYALDAEQNNQQSKQHHCAVIKHGRNLHIYVRPLTMSCKCQ